MTNWRITPEVVNSTISQSRTAIGGIQNAVAGLSESVAQPVIDGGGKDGIVAEALIGFLQDQETTRLTQIALTAENTINSTVAAANAFYAGDEQMAQTSITAAGEAQQTSDETAH